MRKILAADYHRNGVSGAPFYTGIVQDADGSLKSVTVFPDYDDDGEAVVNEGLANPRIAVLDIGLLAEGTVEFGTNSWRGDHYADEARGIIAMTQKQFDEILNG